MRNRTQEERIRPEIAIGLGCVMLAVAGQILSKEIQKRAARLGRP